MNKQMDLKDFLNLSVEDYILIDIRGEIPYSHGHIPGAQLFDIEDIKANKAPLTKDKKIIVYCMKGLISDDVAKDLTEKGFDAYNLVGGYGEWLLNSFEKDNNKAKEIEKSIMKKFRKPLFSKFAKAINTYDLLQEGDKVAVCISGGKDSMLMAKLFQELKRHNKFQFELIFLVMDPGYNEYNRKIIEKNAELLDIPITVFETDIFDTVYNIEKSPCYLCARMRRGHLYNKAKELGCNKIALGHHFDDVIETSLMGMLYGAQIQTMMPKLHSDNFEGMELIRPMYLIREEEINHWRQYNDLRFIQCACRFTNTCTTDGSNGDTGSKRQEIKHLIRQLKETNPGVEMNIFRSMENVNIDTVISYKTKKVKHHFLDHYHE